MRAFWQIFIWFNIQNMTEWYIKGRWQRDTSTGENVEHLDDFIYSFIVVNPSIVFMTYELICIQKLKNKNKSGRKL